MINSIIKLIATAFAFKRALRVDPVEFESYKKMTDSIVENLSKFSCMNLPCEDRQKLSL